MKTLFTILFLTAFTFAVIAFVFVAKGPAIENAAKANSKNVRGKLRGSSQATRNSSPVPVRRSGRSSG